jgi:Cu+-exporting ATPase
MAEADVAPGVLTTCYHCGTPNGAHPVLFDGRAFCCSGCRSVYEILNRNQLCDYYAIADAPGRTSTLRQTSRFSFLDDPSVEASFVERYGPAAVVRFTVPQVHCSSCIWLLENLPQLDRGITNSRTDFLKKSLTVRFNPQQTTLRRVVELLASIGYEPELNLASLGKPARERADRSLYLRLGVAAFCFGTIMLFSLPEYLSSTPASTDSRSFFYYLNFVLSIPVTFYSASVYFASAVRGLAKRLITIDVPLALGIAILFIRSSVELFTAAGPGFFDSLTGLVFLLLIGRVFQEKTYEGLNFDRRYESYLPLAATVRRGAEEAHVPVTRLKPGDRVLLRNQEVLPADGVLMSEWADLDYSFVTGEAHAIRHEQGALLHAGGRILGAAAEVELVREVSQSSLAQVWDAWPRSERAKSRLLTLSNTFGKYFTVATLAVTATTALYWLVRDPAVALNAATAVLIVACPCALSLAAPFAFGTAMRLMGRRRLFLKNASVVESLARVDTVVLDKTGTLTETRLASVRFVGSELNEQERRMVASVAANSAHPLSRSIADAMRAGGMLRVMDFTEREGEGIVGVVDGTAIRLGSASFVGRATDGGSAPTRTRVFLSWNGEERGWFEFDTRYREGMTKVLNELAPDRRLIVLSGDGPAERERLLAVHPGFADLRFSQSPTQKWEYVRALQEEGRAVLMLGDGLNDAGALHQSDVGIAVSEDVSTFSPACDGMLEASAFPQLGRFVAFARSTVGVVYAAIGLSVLYNAVGLWFAVQGLLSPLFAAVLMPLSSISVVAFAAGAVRHLAARKEIV